MTHTPKNDAPRNVRVVRPDGSVLPVEVVYVGTDDQGVRHWDAVATAPALDLDGGRLECDVLPAMTAIRVRVIPPEVGRS